MTGDKFIAGISLCRYNKIVLIKYFMAFTGPDGEGLPPKGYRKGDSDVLFIGGNPGIWLDEKSSSTTDDMVPNSAKAIHDELQSVLEE